MTTDNSPPLCGPADRPEAAADYADTSLEPIARTQTNDAGSIVDPSLPLPAATDSTPNLAPVFNVPVRVQAILGRARMPVERLVSLKAGDVIELDRKVGEPVDIMVNNRLIARGEIVMIENRLGVTLTEIIRQN